MTPPVWAAFVVAAGLGAVNRYLVDGAVRRCGGSFPWGTLAVNVTGSLALGALTGLRLYHGLSATPLVVLGTGFCGAYTTFSTFTLETVDLATGGRSVAACANAIGTAAACLVAAAAGLALAALL